jgi:enoyl-CoA hydratase/carnithine racemase
MTAAHTHGPGDNGDNGDGSDGSAPHGNHPGDGTTADADRPTVTWTKSPVPGTPWFTARLTLSHPRQRNALTFTMYDELERACEDIDADRAVRATVVRGAGGQAFAAGTDIREFRTVHTGEDGVAYERRVGRALDRLAGLRMPVIAAVEGPAIGAGTALVACCDLVVCTPDAVFGAPIGRTLGNCLAPPVVARLYTCFGRARTLYALLTARLITAEEARQAGFVLDVIDATVLGARVDELCADVARCAPLTLAAIKEADRRVLAAAAPDHGDDLYAECYASEDFHEGVTAFLTKRKPHWRDR